MDGCLGNYNESESGGRLRLNSLARTEKGQEERNISGSFCKYLTLEAQLGREKLFRDGDIITETHIVCYHVEECLG